jgi:hypothetical protein
MKAIVPRTYFDRSKPFYPFVLNYIISMHGIIELASRGFVNLLHGKSEYEVHAILSGTKLSVQNKMKFMQNRSTTPLLGDLQLACSFQKDAIKIDVNEIANEVVKEFNYLSPYIIRAGEMLLISAYESTKQFKSNDTIWEFFRHCRNAAAHNGKFKFRKNQPSNLAEWNNFKITNELEGTYLFYTPNNNGMLKVGDPLDLLWDIEQKYPKINL